MWGICTQFAAHIGFGQWEIVCPIHHVLLLFHFQNIHPFIPALSLYSNSHPIFGGMDQSCEKLRSRMFYIQQLPRRSVMAILSDASLAFSLQLSSTEMKLSSPLANGVKALVSGRGRREGAKLGS